MVVLIIDPECLGLDFAIRCAAAGHEVFWFRYHKTPSREGQGFKGFTIIDDWRPYMQRAKDGLILNTGNFRYVYELDQYRAHGFKIFSPTVSSARLEIDRGAGMKAMEAAGIDLLPYEVFDDLQSAAKFARKNDKCFVFKTLGDEDDKALTFVSCSPAEMVGWIEAKIRRGTKLRGRCMLQEKIDADFEIGVNGWFGPEGFLPEKFQISFEHKPLMPGDIGPNTGEMVSVSKYVETDKAVNELLTPMAGALAATGHVGDFCIGAMIDKKGKAYPLEATARCGYPALFGQMASHRGDPAQWMVDLLNGRDTLKVSQDVCMAVVIGQPRFPYNCSTPDMVDGHPIQGLENVYDDVHCCGVMMGRGPVMKDDKVVEAAQFQTAGEYVMVVTGLGKTIAAARKRVYGTIDQIRFPNMIYRNDGGEKVEKALPAMRKAGYALTLE
jgi:phosphoribosylamine--glycine ligase